MSVFKRIANQVLNRAIFVFEKPIVSLMRFVSRRPALANFLMNLLSEFPHLQNHLTQLHRRSDKNSIQFMTNLGHDMKLAIDPEMNRYTRRIYEQLKVAVDENRARD